MDSARERKPPLIVFRVDGSAALGSGHVMRSLTLADELERRGAEVRFVSRTLPGDYRGLVESRGFRVCALPGRDITAGAVERTGQVTSAALEDAGETIAALSGDRPDWLVLDHYMLDREWEQQLRPHARAMLVIDDYLHRRHESDVLLNQNWYGEGAVDGTAYGSSPGRHLDGPRFAMLHPEYVAARKHVTGKRCGIHRILVFFGGSDPTDETAKALEALSYPEFSTLHVDVVVGANHPNPAALARMASQRPGTTLHAPLPSLAGLLARADLAIGGGGTTTWERDCLGVRSIVTTLAENQERIAAALHEAGLITLVGAAGNVAVADYLKALRSMDEVPPDRAPMVDGHGAKRVAEVMLPSATSRLVIRLARQDDALLFFDWRNEPSTRAASGCSKSLSWASHQSWFMTRLAAADSTLMVVEADGLPVGQIRFDHTPEAVILSYSLDSLVRGRGWGTWLVANAVAHPAGPGRKPTCAKVKTSNAASRRIFERLGWACNPSDDEYVTYNHQP